MVRSALSPCARNAGDNSLWRTVSPAPCRDSKITKARSTSLATHLVHPRASPSRRAVCWAQSSHGLSRLPCCLRSKRVKSLALSNKQS